VLKEKTERRLAAVLAADVVAFTRLMGQDEAGTHLRLKAIRRELVDPSVKRHGGRVVKSTGDGALVEFPSALEAVSCAVEVQKAMLDRNADVPQDKRIVFRIGLNVGDLIIDEDDIYGDAVNVAVRLEGLCPPGGLCISRTVRNYVRDKLSYAFDDLGEQQVKNVARPIRVFGLDAGAIGALAPIEARVSELVNGAVTPTVPLPDKPSIAVLPFTNMSGDPEQEYFADGMVEEIITALSRIRWLFVIARNSSFTYKGRAVDVKQVGRELGVRYVLEGSVRRMASRVRITGQLIDAASAAHLWADRFDGSIEDVFELQDNVATSVAGVIEPTLRAAEIRRSAERPTNDLTAYDFFLRAHSHFISADRDGHIQALDLLKEAIERDPHYGPALALAARCHASLHLLGWITDPQSSSREGIALARQALRVAGDDPYVLGPAAFVLAYFGEDLDVAMELIDRALALNPSFASGWVNSGYLRLWAGRPESAISQFEKSLRLSPRANRQGAFFGIGVGHFFAGRLEEAKTMLLRSLQEAPAWAPTYRFLAASYAYLGQLDEAQETVKQLRAITPLVMPSATHWRIAEQREYFLKGLRLAGKRWADPGNLNPCALRSRRRMGTCELSARLFFRFPRTCVRERPSSAKAAP
jgi:TolB-like protein/class 3 adenylate cyclase